MALERRKIQMKVAEPIAAQAGGRIVQADMKIRAPRDTGGSQRRSLWRWTETRHR